jgi:putative spermidine/putrescine transport system permease protein
MSRAESVYHRLVVWVLFIILVLPLAATLIYALVEDWGATRVFWWRWGTHC